MRTRTGYSFRTAVGTIDEVLARLQEIGMDTAPISDRASTFGWVKWNKAARKLGLRPIFGVELGVSPNPTAKKPEIDHWTFFAKDDIVHVNHLVNLATSQFRYEPLLTYDQALIAPGVVKIAGHRAKIELMKPDADLAIALSPSLSRGQFNRAKKAKIKFIYSSDNMYTNECDREFYEVTCGRGASIQSYPQHILDNAEWTQGVERWASTRDIKQAVATLHDFTERSQAALRMGAIYKPERPQTLLEMCVDGANKLGVNLGDEVYRARMERELALIAEKDFEDYFYIIADLVQWSRERMAVGPARGSSCGSLVCYLLQITTIDPIPFGLIFERFIDINRDDLPDIDIDFSDTKRHLVFEYMENKYGRDRVARLGTVAMFQPRSSVNEVSGALNIPKWKTEKALDGLIERSSGDSRALNTLEDTLKSTRAGTELLAEHPEIMVAAKMEGHPRHAGQHAAGIILTQESVENFVALDARTGATHCDKKDAEELDLLKIDALGLTQLSVFEDVLEAIGKEPAWLDTLPTDDPKAFAILNEKRWSGIFQFMGGALNRLTQQITVEELNDIISITALARPGPLASGGAEDWVNRRTGAKPIEYPHPIFEPYLRDTMGVVIYQEQVMQIGREIGDLNWGQVTALRKAMSKSLGTEFFDQYGDPFKAGAIAKGVPPERAAKIWDDLCAYGSWSFNKSHSVAYGMVSYQCCYLKAHYPVEFAAATLTHEKDDHKQLNLLREMVAEGVQYKPFDAKQSTDKWRAATVDGERVLVGPLTNVRGLGPKLCSQVLSSRARGEPLPKRAKKLLETGTTPLDDLFPIKHRIAAIMPDPAEKNIYTPNTDIIKIETNGRDEQEFLVFGLLTKIAPRSVNDAQRVAKRGKKLKGPEEELNLWFMDDTDDVFCKIQRYDYQRLAPAVLERGRAGKALYAIKGTCPRDFRMISIKQIRYLGDMEEGYDDAKD